MLTVRRLAAFAALLLAGLLPATPAIASNPKAFPAIVSSPESARVPDGARPARPPVGAPFGLVSRHISVRGLHLIEGFEGWDSCPYWDSYGGVWTRGYGETEGISSGSPCISRADGELKLRRLVEARYEWALRALHVPLNQNQWDALDSFVWNLGAGIFEGTSVGADLRARNYRAAAAVMLFYDHAGGVVLAGLRTRREAEVRLFLTPVAEPACDARCRRVRLASLEAERAKIRRHLVNSGCRVARPRAACEPLFRRGARVNREIRALEAHHS